MLYTQDENYWIAFGGRIFTDSNDVRRQEDKHFTSGLYGVGVLKKTSPNQGISPKTGTFVLVTFV